MRYEDLTRIIIGAAMEVHKALGNAAAGITVALEVEQQDHELVTYCDRFEKLKHGLPASYVSAKQKRVGWAAVANCDRKTKVFALRVYRT